MVTLGLSKTQGQGMAERDTHSFKISTGLLGFVISAVIGAIGGGSGTAAYLQQQPAPTYSQFVTRDEFERRFGSTDKQLERIEAKLDRLNERANQPLSRR